MTDLTLAIEAAVAKLAERLESRLTLRFMGDCKCGNCHLVPRDDLCDAAASLRNLAALIAALNLDLVSIKDAVEGEPDDGCGPYGAVRHMSDERDAMRARIAELEAERDRLRAALSAQEKGGGVMRAPMHNKPADKAALRSVGLRICSFCAGKGSAWNARRALVECDWCGGVGLRKPCRLSDCREYGCGGTGHCSVTAETAARFGYPARRERRDGRAKAEKGEA